MKFNCPHCKKNLEIADELSGHAMDCPSCQQALTVPALAVAMAIPVREEAPKPPANSHPPKLRRPAPGNYTPPKPPRRGGGFGKFLLTLIVLAGAGFGYAMVHFNESPQQVWKRLLDVVETMMKPAPVPTPIPEAATPTPTPSPTPEATPEPPVTPTPTPTPVDPLAWLLERIGNIITGYVSPDGTNWAATDVGRIEAPVPSTIYVGLVVCSAANGTLNTSTFGNVQITGGNGGAPAEAPAAPAALLAAPASNAVLLRWQSSFDATSYTVKRATTSGGPYATVASGITASSYTDPTATNGTTYHYVVSAVNAAGESPNSPEDVVTPTAPMWNVALGGTATATIGPDSAGRAFDNNSRTIWFAGRSGGVGAIQYDFGAGRAPAIKAYTVTSPDARPEHDPRDWQFQGSNDGKDWTTLDTQSGQTFPSRFYEMEYALPKPASCRYFRLNVTANNGDNDLHIADIKLLSDEPMPNAPIAPLLHWRANDTADRERAIARQKAIESEK